MQTPVDHHTKLVFMCINPEKMHKSAMLKGNQYNNHQPVFTGGSNYAYVKGPPRQTAGDSNNWYKENE